ncbi:hypothetical protein YC2023_032894 [Brassica napus]
MEKITLRDTISLCNYTLKHIVLEEHFLKMLLRPYPLTNLTYAEESSTQKKKEPVQSSFVRTWRMPSLLLLPP